MAPPTKSDSVIKKRRVIYMTDAEWAQLGTRAADAGLSRSALLATYTELPIRPAEPIRTTLEWRPVPKPGKKRA